MYTRVRTPEKGKERAAKPKSKPKQRVRERLNITLDSKTIELLKQRTHNISRFIEDLVLSALQQKPTAVVHVLPVSFAGVAESGKGAGFRVPYIETAGEAIIDYDRYAAEFAQWIHKEIREKEAEQYIRDLERTIAGKKINHPSELAEIFSGLPKHYQVAIKNFMKFLIKKGYRTKSELIDFQEIIKVPKSGIRPASEAFTTTKTIQLALTTQIRKDKEKDARNKFVIKALAYSGLRLEELMDLLNHFKEDELKIIGKIARYDLLAMYKRIGSRKAQAEATKRAWVAYLPASFVKELKKYAKTEEWKSTTFKGVKLAKGIVDPNQFRKWFTEFLDENDVKEKIIGFITGKTPENVLRRSYMNLLKQADREYARIVDKFPI